MDVDSICWILVRGCWGFDKEIVLVGLGLGFYLSYDWKVL